MARTFELDLPVGYSDEEGRLHRHAVLRKMTGREEALLADRKLRRNGGRLVSELLSQCLLQLDDMQPVSRQVVGRLTSADRNFLLMELRKITFGDTLEATYQCPRCGVSSRVEEDLNELPVRRIDGEGPPLVTVELEDGFEDKGGEVHTRFVFRLPNGIDEEKTGSLMRENTSLGTNALLTRCLQSVGDMPAERREAMGTKLLSDLTLADRARIEQAFRRDTPGVDMTREAECDACGFRFQTSIDLSAFFTLRQDA